MWYIFRQRGVLIRNWNSKSVRINLKGMTSDRVVVTESFLGRRKSQKSLDVLRDDGRTPTLRGDVGE